MPQIEIIILKTFTTAHACLNGYCSRSALDSLDIFGKEVCVADGSQTQTNGSVNIKIAQYRRKLASHGRLPN